MLVGHCARSAGSSDCAFVEANGILLSDYVDGLCVLCVRGVHDDSAGWFVFAWSLDWHMGRDQQYHHILAGLVDRSGGELCAALAKGGCTGSYSWRTRFFRSCRPRLAICVA